MSFQIREKLPTLPTQPGCYLMTNDRGVVIYVGKATNLRQRVRSYFTGQVEGKTIHLVREIDDLEYIVTDTVQEALLLECGLIKHHRPRYNVLLKDDKTYPYIRLSKERHPRLSITRRVRKDGARYFGPYPNARAAQQTKRLLDRLFPLRKCRNIPKQPCLYYHMKQCLAPCIQKVASEQYQELTREIVSLLQGKNDTKIKELHMDMEKFAENLEFEKAREVRDLLRDVAAIVEKQSVVLPDLLDRDVFGWIEEDGWLAIQVFFVRQGKLIERDGHAMEHYHSLEEDLLSYLAQFYRHNPAIPSEILLYGGEIQESLQAMIPQSQILVPKRGAKQRLVAMATRNAGLVLKEQKEILVHHRNQYSLALQELGRSLRIPFPHRIEMVDQAHWQGKAMVAAVVVFIDGVANKSAYRRFNIKTAGDKDDYAALREVVRRRYTRLIREGEDLPDLLLVDGGKGHVRAAMDVLEGELGVSIPIAGLRKDNRHQTAGLVSGEPPLDLELTEKPQLAPLLQTIQAEVHRFAIVHHRKLRHKNMHRSILDDIPGVGPKRRQQLLQYFGSIAAIKQASLQDYRSAGIHEALAKRIQETLHAKETESESSSLS
nr:excinuclease ABC subunit UvrC [Pasteuria penetrans]